MGTDNIENQKDQKNVVSNQIDEHSGDGGGIGESNNVNSNSNNPSANNREREDKELEEIIGMLRTRIGVAKHDVTDFGKDFCDQINNNLNHAKEILEKIKSRNKRPKYKKYKQHIEDIKREIEIIKKHDQNNLTKEYDLLPVSRSILYCAFAIQFIWDKEERPNG